MQLNELTDEVEAISERYARKLGFERDAAWFLLKLNEEVGELNQAFLMKAGQARAKGKSAEELGRDFRSEVADVVCQALLLARFHGIDLEAAIADKWLVWSPDRSPSPTEAPRTPI